MKIIIEHMEKGISDWTFLEYSHISEKIGKENLIFTNVKEGKEKLSILGEVKEESVSQLEFQNPCILDPKAELVLSPNDNEKFEVLIFGGILGDYPPRERTSSLTSSMKSTTRNLGIEQMSTDTAVIVASKIMAGTPFNELKFQDEIEIELAPDEEVQLPFRYLIENGKPLIAPGLKEYLKETEEF